MVPTSEIQIFVSCPSDVEPEKKVLIEVCNRINTQLRDSNCKIRYSVKNWRDIIGNYGVNAQQSINEVIGDYDIYLGIWWMKFGSKTGNINSTTGEEFESGTYEEFTIAKEKWVSNKQPEIVLFFKNAIACKNKLELDQFGKILDFKDNLKGLGMINDFETIDKFKDIITDLLYPKAFKISNVKLVDQKQVFLNTNIEFKAQFKIKVQANPPSYLLRKTSHFNTIKEKINNPFLQVEKQTLSELITKQNKIIVLGDAGSGKSTELRNLYNEYNKDNTSLIPIYQQLNRYTPDLGIDNFLPPEWKEIPKNLLLIIWDGLDEIQPEHFNTVIRQITVFIEKNIEAKFIISCRTNFYELPVNNAPGTLLGFEPYFLNDLELFDVKKYYSNKYNDVDAELFIKEIFDNKLEDIITKPFFLMLLADRYSESKKLSVKRADLYELFILSRFDFDQSHFKSTFDIRDKKEEIISLLEKVALSMEVLAKNFIDESDALKIISSSEFKTLKYCTAFNKKEGEDNIWQFEHNNIQEYLAAKALSKLSFDKVIQFLTFEKPHNKLIPSWVNTLTFLFSILNPEDELFIDLTKWIFENEKEIIVKFERDKISSEIRNEIFQGIFNYYKSHDVWIRSNNFNDKDLSKFGQSEISINFLLEEVQFEQNTRTTKINAISLLGHFEYDNLELKTKTINTLLNQIDININDAEFIRTCIYALNYSELANSEIIDSLIKTLHDKKNQYIRSAIYSLLLKHNYYEDYIDFLIDGYELLDEKNNPERNGVNLLDESWNLNESIKKIKSVEGLKKLLTYISSDNHLSHAYGADEIIKEITNNAIIAYANDTTIFDNVFEWFLNEIKTYSVEKLKFTLEFFSLTNTRNQAFDKFWNMAEDINRNKSYALSSLATKENVEFIINKYNSHDITNNDLEWFIHNLQWTRNENYTYFEDLIKSKTSYQLNITPKIDYDGIRKRKQQESFSLLFDFKEFEKETLRIFDDEKKTVLTFDELYDIRKENGKYVELEDYYSGTALRLLRDLCRPNSSISKGETIDWFKKKKNIEWYTISLIQEHISNNKEIIITETQKRYIEAWCMKNIKTFDFKNAITQKGDSTSTKTIAVYLWFFSRTLNIKYSDDVLLDMLSFDYIEQHDFMGIDYIINQLDKDKISKRISDNLKSTIVDVHVLKNHVKYATENQLIETYPFIVKEIINLKYKYYDRNEFLNIFFENTKDIEALKNIIDQGDSNTRWEVVEKLRISNEYTFLEPYLINILNKEATSDEAVLASENLIMMQNIEGLQFYVKWLKTNPKFDSNRRRVHCLQILKTLDALPLLIDLLALSYQTKIAIEPFEDLGSVIINALYNIALISENNFIKVKKALEKFMTENKNIFKDVNYLLHTISRLEQQFYMNKAKVYTIEQVKKKIKLIE